MLISRVRTDNWRIAQGTWDGHGESQSHSDPSRGAKRRIRDSNPCRRRERAVS
jgi:hypothetical protein